MSTHRLGLTLLAVVLSVVGSRFNLAPAAQVPRAAPLQMDIAEQRQRHCCDALAIAPDGRVLATTQYGVVTLWDLDSGLELRTLVPQARAIAGGPPGPVASVAHDSYSGLAFDPSGRYVALTAPDNVNPRTFTRSSLLAIPHVCEVETGRDMSAVDWAYDAAAQRTGSPAFPFNPTETVFWQVTSDPAVASLLARYRGAATTFSADGRLGIGFTSDELPGNYLSRLTGFDLRSSEALWTKRIPGSGPPFATLSPDSQWVVIVSSVETVVLDARTGAQVARLPGGNHGLPISFSRDSSRLVVVDGREVYVFAVTDWRVVAQMHAPDEGLSVVLTPDGRRVIGVSGESLHVWDATTAEEIRRTSMDGARPIQALAVGPRGRWLAAGTARVPPSLSTRVEWPATAVLWPLAGDTAPVSLWTEDEVSIRALAFSADEEWIGGVSFAEIPARMGPVYDGQLSVHTLATGAHERVTDVAAPDAAMTDLAFTSDGSTLAVATLERRTDHPDHEFEPHPALALFDARTLEGRHVVDIDGSEFTALAASPDGKMLATGHDANTLRLWTTATGRQRGLFRWPAVDRRDVLGSALFGDSITSLAFHPNGRRLAVARHAGVAVVDVVRRTRREIAGGKGQGYSAVAYSPDGSSLLYASGTVQGRDFVDARVSQWVTATDSPGWTVPLGATEVPRLVFGPTGKWFAAATNAGVSIHNAVTGAHLATFALLATNDWLVWTPDGRYAGSLNGIARLAAVRQGRRAVPLESVGRRLELADLLRQVLP